MHTSSFPRRRRRLGAIVAGLCVAAGSIGTVALADTSASASVSVDASVLVQVGMSPVNARQTVASLNSAIDSAASAIARSAATAVPAGRPIRTTAAATKAYANEIDAALTQYAISSIGGLRSAGVATQNLVPGTMAALAQVVRTIPGAVAVATGAEIAVASGADGTQVSASLNPVLDLALRQTIGDMVRAIRPVLPLTRATVRSVAGGVRQVVDATVVAVVGIVDATVDFAGAVLNVTGGALQAVDAVASAAVAGLNTVVVAVDSVLDNLSDVNLTATVDASLHVSAH